MRLIRRRNETVDRASVRRRTGFTIAETVVVLVLLAIVGASLTNVLSKQQQFYQSTGDVISMRTQLRQGEAILGNDLRGISTVGGDLTAMTDSSIDFYYTIGESVACKAPSGATIVIPPTGSLTNGNTLTSWLSTPAVGDVAYVFDEGLSATSSDDDTWKSYTVSGINMTTGTCDAGFNTGGTGGTVTFGSNVSATILDGAPIRFVRQAHYSLYQSSSDHKWYLGYCSGACSVSNPINPVAGPFRPYVPSSATDTSGIRITYFDSTGTSTSTLTSVARINIILRGQSSSYLRITGMTKGFYNDSVRMDVAMRNRS